MSLIAPYSTIFYIADGTTRTYSYNFEPINAQFISADVKHADGTITYDVPVTVDAEPDGRLIGTITFDPEDTPESGAIILIQRTTPQEQATEYGRSIRFNPKNIETSFDLVVAMIQELSNKVNQNTLGLNIFQTQPFALDLMKEQYEGATLEIDYTGKLLKAGLHFKIESGNLNVSTDGQSWIMMPKSTNVVELKQVPTSNPDIKELQYRVGDIWYSSGASIAPIAEEALEKANQAIEMATTATQTSTEAKSLATEANENAEIALNTARTANTKSDTAISTANTALTTANTAITTAQRAENKADNAVQTADSADEKADQAVETAESADNKADQAITAATNADTKATTALSNSQTALSNSQQAITTANAASQAATQAVNTANTALSTAQSADSKSDSAVATANAADTKSDNAVATANAADTKATNAVQTAGEAKTIAEGIEGKADQAIATANAASTTATNAYNKAEQAEQAVATKQDKLTAGEGIVIDENNVISTVLPKYLSVERLDAYIYKATFDAIPEYDPGVLYPVNGACTSFVRNGKLYRNYDWKYDNTAEFMVVCKEFQGMASIFGMNDGALDIKKIEQLPYHLVDGVNKSGIKVSTHVLYNDWTYAGAGDKDQDIMLLPYYILSNLHDISNINTVLGNYVSNIKIPEILANAEYLLQFVVTDGTTTYCIMPPASETGSYVIQDITSNPKLTNFRWVSDATVVRADLQTRPTGVERWNEVATSDLEDLRFTKCYEEPTRLSEFIGTDDTTKDSSDAELTVIYNRAHTAYQTRTRDGVLWQTVHSIVLGADSIEYLWCQENWDKDYINSGNVDDVKVNGTSVVTNKVANVTVPTKTSDLTNDSGFITSSYHDATKQDVISDLATIRSGATAGSTAIQPDDNISELTNDANYQNGSQVTASISTHNTSTTAHSDIRSAISGKQDQLTAGTNVDITDNVISATDTKYTAGNGLTLTGTQFSANVVNNITSTSTTNALSANMGKELQDQINNLKQRGRYLSIWNCTTGLAETTPTVDPYEYKAGDYFIVGVVGTTNYRPSGSTYSESTPSTVVETGDVKINDTYYYDGTTWTLLDVGQVASTFASLGGSPYDNANLASALNAKADIDDLATVATSGSYDDLSDKPTIPAAQVPADWNATTGVSRILNKPTIPTVPTNISAFTNDSNYQTGTQVSSAISSHNSSSSAHSSLFNAKANDTDVVHKIGAETIAGAKTFTNPMVIQTNTNKGFELYSPSSGGYLYVTRGGDDPVTMAIKSGTSGGTFGTVTNHQFQFRTNDTARMVIGVDGSVKLQQSVSASSNDGQVASTKWVNDKGYQTSTQVNSAISTHNSNASAHSDIRSAVSSKSTVSVSATGTATDEVSYITIDGVQKKLAGGGGGSEEDNLSITKNASNKIQTVGVIDQHNTSRAVKEWFGTRAEYDAITTKDGNTEYTITDDGDISLPLLQTLYPVGSVYITFNETCPLANLFGTWQKVGGGRVLQGADSSHVAGSTIEAGLPNITGTISMRDSESVNGSGAWSTKTGAFKSNTGDYPYVQASISGGWGPRRGNINFNANDSNAIYGSSTTVQPPAICINIFRRTA